MAEDVWGADALQDSCTVQAVLISNGSQLKKWNLSLAVLAMGSTHLKAQALRWAQGSKQPAEAEPAPAPAGAPDAAVASEEAQHPPAKRQRLRDDGAEPGSGSASSTRKVLVIQVESAGEVPVVEACLRFAYVGTKALEELLSQGLPQLLAVFKWADYLGMSSCCKAVLEAAARLKMEDVGIDDAVQAWGRVMPDNEQVRQLCSKVLLHHMGDILLVMRDEELQKRLLTLPLPALLALLDSSDLATDSEDSVVSVVGCWVGINNPTDVETKQLADRLRLLQLSETYLLTVVPAMPWLAQHLPLEAFGRLTGAQRAAQVGGDRVSRAIYPRETDSEAWFITSKRPVSAAGATGVLLDDHVTRQLIVDTLLPKLRADGRLAGTWSPIQLLAHGYMFSLAVYLHQPHNSVYVCVRATLPRAVEGVVGHPAWRLKCSLSRQVPGGTYTKMWHGGATGRGAQCSYYYSNPRDAIKLPDGKSVINIADVAEVLLVDGKLRLKVEVSACSAV